MWRTSTCRGSWFMFDSSSLSLNCFALLLSFFSVTHINSCSFRLSKWRTFYTKDQRRSAKGEKGFFVENLCKTMWAHENDDEQSFSERFHDHMRAHILTTWKNEIIHIVSSKNDKTTSDMPWKKTRFRSTKRGKTHKKVRSDRWFPFCSSRIGEIIQRHKKIEFAKSFC